MSQRRERKRSAKVRNKEEKHKNKSFRACFAEYYMTATASAPCYTPVHQCVRLINSILSLKKKCKGAKDHSSIFYSLFLHGFHPLFFFFIQFKWFIVKSYPWLKLYRSFNPLTNVSLMLLWQNRIMKSICSLYFFLFLVPPALIDCIVLFLITVSHCSLSFVLCFSLSGTISEAWKMKLLLLRDSRGGMWADLTFTELLVLQCSSMLFKVLGK